MNFIKFEKMKVFNKNILFFLIIIIIVPISTYFYLNILDKSTRIKNEEHYSKVLKEVKTFESNISSQLGFIANLTEYEIKREGIDRNKMKIDLENYKRMRITLLKYLMKESDSLNFNIEFIEQVRQAFELGTIKEDMVERYTYTSYEELGENLESLYYIKDNNLTYEDTPYSPHSYNVINHMVKFPISYIIFLVFYYFIKKITLDDFEHGIYKSIINNKNRKEYSRSKIISVFMFLMGSLVILVLTIFCISLLDYENVYKYSSKFLGFGYVVRNISIKYLVSIEVIQFLLIGIFSLVFGRISWDTNNYISYGIGILGITYIIKYFGDNLNLFPLIILDTELMRSVELDTIKYLYILIFMSILAAIIIYYYLMEKDFT